MIARELKEKLRSRQTQIGTFVKLADPTALEVLGLAGMDFAIIDTEHAPCDQMLLLDMIRAADSVGLPTIVRVPEGTEPHILKALDIGASGVQIPGLSTVEEIREAVSFTKYAPGAYGACPLPSARRATAQRKNSSICRIPMTG